MKDEGRRTKDAVHPCHSKWPCAGSKGLPLLSATAAHSLQRSLVVQHHYAHAPVIVAPVPTFGSHFPQPPQCPMLPHSQPVQLPPPPTHLHTASSMSPISSPVILASPSRSPFSHNFPPLHPACTLHTHLHTASSMSSLSIIMHSPRSSLPRRPALPLIWMYSDDSIHLQQRACTRSY